MLQHVRTYVYTLQTDKHERFKIDGLKLFFNVFFFKNILTHGYTCVNPVLVLFYTCVTPFFQVYTCVTPFFSGLHMCNSIFFGLHIATHGHTWLHTHYTSEKFSKIASCMA